MVLYKPFTLLILLSSFPVWACEAPPVMSEFCTKHDPIVNISKENLERLNEEVHLYEKLRHQFANEDDLDLKKRYGDGSCYLMNHSTFYLTDLMRAKEGNLGKICQGAMKELVSSVKSLISPKSRVFSHIEIQAKAKILHYLSTQIQKRLDLLKFEG